MKLVIIYGPPAAGKHTVGKKLSELTGYKFFYNHLTVDVVRVLFDDEDERRNELLSSLRVPVIETAADYDMNIVFTVGYTDDSYSRAFIKQLVQVVTEKGGAVHFVRLNPPDSTLFEHVVSESRRKLGKSTTPEHLRQMLKAKNFRTTIDYPSTLELDTSKLSPEQLANQIIEHFGLL